MMNFLNLSIAIFSTPSKVFQAIDNGYTRWWHPWIVMSVIYVISSYFGLPIQIAVMEMNPMDLDPAMLEQQLSDMDKFAFFQLAIVPFGMLIYSLVFTGVSYIFVSIFSSSSDFKKYLTLSLYAGIIGSLAQVIGVLVVRSRGIESLRSPDDAVVSVSLRFLASGDSLFYKAVLSSLEFFTIWSFVVIVMGLMHIFDLSRNRAVVCVLPLWVLLVFFLFGNLQMSGAG